MNKSGISRNTWIMVAVFFLLLIVFFGLQNSGDDAAQDVAALPTPEISAALFDFDLSTITGFRVANLDGQAVEVVKSGEVWLLSQPAAPAEQTDLARIQGLIAGLATLRLITDASIESPLNVLGLDIPRYLLTVTLSDGTVHVLAIGDASVTGSGYYVSLDGRPPQLVTKSVLDQFISLLENPPLLPTAIPEPTEPISDTLPLTPVDPEEGISPESGETQQP